MFNKIFITDKTKIKHFMSKQKQSILYNSTNNFKKSFNYLLIIVKADKKKLKCEITQKSKKSMC